MFRSDLRYEGGELQKEKEEHVKSCADADASGGGGVDRWGEIGMRYRPERKYTTESD